MNPSLDWAMKEIVYPEIRGKGSRCCQVQLNSSHSLKAGRCLVEASGEPASARKQVHCPDRVCHSQRVTVPSDNPPEVDQRVGQARSLSLNSAHAWTRACVLEPYAGWHGE